MILAPWRISKVCIWIDEQRLLECRFADQEILDTRNHLVPRAVHPHGLEG
jgi:hypothetical protein